MPNRQYFKRSNWNNASSRIQSNERRVWFPKCKVRQLYTPRASNLSAFHYHTVKTYSSCVQLPVRTQQLFIIVIVSLRRIRKKKSFRAHRLASQTFLSLIIFFTSVEKHKNSRQIVFILSIFTLFRRPVSFRLKLPFKLIVDRGRHRSPGLFND
jgi:hypothetical protein